MYQALYRKWRPQTFEEVIGQQQVTQTLKNQVINDRLSHAYLFIGSRGTGKTTCARILAKAVNCEHPRNGNPCGECASCRGIADGSVLDVVELDAASNNGVDNVRALREEAVFSPGTVKKRVYIIDEVHMLTAAAFNALLKILEEPPKHLMFILATTELQKVPATILSRCQRHIFRRIDAQTLTDYLETIAKRESFSLTHGAAELIARLAEGGVRDALSLLDQCSASETIDEEAVYRTMGLAGNRRVAEMLEHILAHETNTVLSAFNGMWMDGRSPAGLLGELSGLMRDVLMLHVAPGGARELLSGAYDTAILESLAKRMTTEELLAAMDTVQRCLSSLRDTQNTRMQVELCLVSLCEATGGDSFASLRARISRLEEDMARGVPALHVAVRRDASEDDWERDLPPDEVFTDEPEDGGEDEYLPPPEEQPEDEFLQRRTVDPVPEQRGEPSPAPAVKVRFQDVLEAVKPRLSFDLRVQVDDSAKLRGRLEGDVLRLEALPPFIYNRMKNQDVLQIFAEEARRLLGGEVRVQLTELRPQQREARDLNELRGFPEVKFKD